MKNISLIILITCFTMILSGCNDKSSGGRPNFKDKTPTDPNGGQQCLAIDTDGDGLRDCEDPDIDNDGWLNEVDAFPYDKNEWIDTDGDGVGDNSDWAPEDPTEWADTDGDGIGDNTDPDDDDDGVPDLWDRFRTRNLEYFDTDFDSLGNNEDPDDDNDGVPDLWDDLPWRMGGFDIDGDGIPNDSDGDIDGDGFINEMDAFPWDPEEWYDYDADSIGDNADPDDDNDGVPDVWDAFQFNRNYQFDWDGDGVANDIDAFPYDPNEWTDSDGDGVGDNFDAFPNDPFEWADTDGDGVGDNTDPDIDNDGYLNQLPTKPVQQVECYAQRNEATCLTISGCGWTSQNRCAPMYSCIAGGNNAACSDTGNPVLCSSLPNPIHPIVQAASCNSDPGCDWNGVTCDQKDFFPMDDNEHLDNDLDGLGDNEDPDDDNDGFPDHWDDFPFNPRAFLDFDNDNLLDWELPVYVQDMVGALPNNYAIQIDPDSDNDGVPDIWDSLAWDPTEYYDIDGDGIGDNLDQDDDNDGYPDNIDAFPYDPTEWLDSDGDSIGNNADPDDDNDGVPDIFDTLEFNPNGFSDLNGDGVPDQTAIDIDGDLYENQFLVCVGPVNNFSCSYPDSIDVFIWDQSEWFDFDSDGLGDNEDPDDDNDGVPDIWDKFPRTLNSSAFSDLDDDGIPDEEDLDIDGDGIVNDDDIFPRDPLEWSDWDGDGLGDNVDPDSDNDGVPNYWDDFPYYAWDNYPSNPPPGSWDNEKVWWADTDGDGIPNYLDIWTPNGINNEDDMDTAILHGENLSFTSDITITKCYNIPGFFEISSNEEPHTITYMGPDDGCMFNLTSHEVSIANIIFHIPEGKKGTLVRTTVPGGLNNVAIHQNIFKFDGIGMIADMRVKGLFGFTRNNMILDTNVDLGGTGYENIVKIAAGTGLANNDEAGYLIAGNIIFWNINENQTQPISFIKNTGDMRAVGIQFNSFKLNKNETLNPLVAPSAFASVNVDFRPAWTNEEKGMSVFLNRVNMNDGQFINLTSSYAMEDDYFITHSNKIFGISDIGNANLNDNNSEDQNLFCSGITNNVNNLCSNNTQCTWNGVTPEDENGSCLWNGIKPKSYTIWYDFGLNDVFLAPERNDFSMFYQPNQGKLDNSPAIFSDFVYEDELEVFIVEALDLGMGKVAYIGFYPPVMDQDGDTFPDSIDLYPLNEFEWFNNDGDELGNNSDPDDDNDEVLDIYELSYCRNEMSAFSCNPKAGCFWDDESFACKRNGLYCLVPDSVWDYDEICCLKDGICVDGTDPFQSDTDGDGLTDYEEMYVYFTDPLNPDTDFDGDNDASEIANGTDPKDPLSSGDSDGDTLSDNFEIVTFIPMGCVNPHLNPDSDGDGLNDYLEYMVHGTNPCVQDTDGDGVTDYVEIQNGTNPLNPDTDGDGLSDGDEALHGTDPLNPDSDGDGSKDGAEILDGTDPLDSNSFKDTDGDGESDYSDVTPYGATPCSNANIALCNGAFTQTQLQERLTLQIAEALSCGTKTTQGTCFSPISDLCKWDAGQGQCLPKDIVVFHDIELNQCYDISSTNNQKANIIKIRSRPNTRKTITVPNTVFNSATCSEPSQGGIFSLSPNTGLILENIDFIAEDDIPVLIGDTSQNNRGGYSFEAKGVSFLSERNNGASFLKIKNYSKVSLEKTTLRQTLGSAPTSNILSLLDITYNANFCSPLNQTNCQASSEVCSWNGSACEDRGLSELSITGTVANCNTNDYLLNLFTNNRTYSCVSTQSPTTVFAGNSIIFGEFAALSSGQIDSGSNNLRAWTHTQGSGTFRMYENRFFSRSNTIKVNNPSSSLIGGSGQNCTVSEACNIGSIDGANRPQISWTGVSSPSISILGAVAVNYEQIFKDDVSPELYCYASGTGANAHPAYFPDGTIRSFWTRITNRSGGNVQIPGAVGQLCGP